MASETSPSPRAGCSFISQSPTKVKETRRSQLHAAPLRSLAKPSSASTLFSELPVELLGEIIALVASTTPPTRAHLGWLTLGHVCTRLRVVFLSQHVLWARIVCALPVAHMELVRRAGDVPLHIVLSDLHAGISDDTVQFAMAHLARAAEVSVREHGARRRLWTRTPTSLSGASFPYLQSLTLKTLLPWIRDSDYNGAFDKTVYDLPPIHAPSLRRVYIENNFVPFDAAQLTHLTLRATKRDEMDIEVFLPTEEQFLRMLRQCINLEELRLYGWIPELKYTCGTKNQIALPRLRRLYIWASLPRCAALIGRLHVPRHTTFDVSVDNLPLDARGSPLVDLATRPSYVDTRRVEIVGTLSRGLAPTGLCIVLEPRADHARFILFTTDRDTGTHARLLDLEFYRWGLDANVLRETMSVLYAGIDLECVRTLEIQGHCAALGEKALWREILMPLVNVESARVDFWSIAEAGRLVCEILDPRAEQPKIALPRLRELAVPMRGHFAVDPRGWCRGDGVGARGRFIEALKERKELGKSIEKVVLEGVTALGLPGWQQERMFAIELQGIVRDVGIQ